MANVEKFIEKLCHMYNVTVPATSQIMISPSASIKPPEPIEPLIEKMLQDDGKRPELHSRGQA